MARHANFEQIPLHPMFGRNTRIYDKGNVRLVIFEDCSRKWLYADKRKDLPTHSRDERGQLNTLIQEHF